MVFLNGTVFFLVYLRYTDGKYLLMVCIYIYIQIHIYIIFGKFGIYWWCILMVYYDIVWDDEFCWWIPSPSPKIRHFGGTPGLGIRRSGCHRQMKPRNITQIWFEGKSSDTSWNREIYNICIYTCITSDLDGKIISFAFSLWSYRFYHGHAGHFILPCSDDPSWSVP